MNHSQQPVRLYFKSYIQMINNSVGSHLFRNFYLHTDKEGDFDALNNGKVSCAFFVSSILVIFKKLAGIHGTVKITVKDLRDSGWVEVDNPELGDVLVWEATLCSDGLREHIGFCLGNGRAVSTSSKKKTPLEHDMYFGRSNRKLIHIFRMQNWD